jgi:hypothetical protein
LALNRLAATANLSFPKMSSGPDSRKCGLLNNAISHPSVQGFGVFTPNAPIQLVNFFKGLAGCEYGA